ncbi:MAG: ribosome maturation factor RimP [Cyclobacteriaceae bacterium]
MSTEPLESKIRQHVENILVEDESLFIVSLNLRGNQGNQKLEIYLDGDEGISIDQCSALSRRLSAILEEEEILTGKYILEVSSAGLDQPLSQIRQYKKNIGRSLSVNTKDGHKIEGELLEVIEEKVIKIKPEKSKEATTIELDNIEKAKVLVSFK